MLTEHMTSYMLMIYCRYMDEIQEKMDGIEEDSEIMKDIYMLIDQYQVPVNPEDLAVYQVLTV